jgi:hypothetical protein
MRRTGRKKTSENFASRKHVCFNYLTHPRPAAREKSVCEAARHPANFGVETPRFDGAARVRVVAASRTL